MSKLHFLGITHDHKGLVVSEHARAEHGDFILDIDDRLLEAIEEASRQRQREEGRQLVSAALPTRRERDPERSSLSPKEIQAQLRMGQSIAAVAKEAGAQESWIERFAPPVLAEQAQEQAKGSPRPRGSPGQGTGIPDRARRP